MSTQTEALKKTKKSGKAAQLRAEVLRLIDESEENGGISRRQIAVYLDCEDRLSSITARVNELLKAGEIFEHGTTVCPTTDMTVALLHPTSAFSEYPHKFTHSFDGFNNILPKKYSKKELEAKVHTLEVENKKLQEKQHVIVEFLKFANTQNVELNKLVQAFKGGK